MLISLSPIKKASTLGGFYYFWTYFASEAAAGADAPASSDYKGAASILSGLTSILVTGVSAAELSTGVCSVSCFLSLHAASDSIVAEAKTTKAIFMLIIIHLHISHQLLETILLIFAQV